MKPPSEFVPAGANLPDVVQRAHAQASTVVDREAVTAALDRLAVHLTVRFQAERPHLLTLLPGGAYLAAGLLTRMVYPCRLHFWQPDTPLPMLDDGAPVIVLHSGRSEKLLEGSCAALVAGGVSQPVCVTMVPTPGAELSALDVSVAADLMLLGCGYDVAGYGANLPALYGYSPSN